VANADWKCMITLEGTYTVYYAACAQLSSRKNKYI